VQWNSIGDGPRIDDLRTAFLERPPPFVYGVGVWFGPGVERPRLLVIVDSQDVRVKPLPFSTGHSSPPFDEPTERQLVVGTVDEATARLRDAMGDWLSSSVVLPSDRPDPLLRLGSTLRDAGTGGRGTVGAALESRAGPAILTAGHVVSGLGAVMERRGPFPWQTKRAFGRVGLHSDPVAVGSTISSPGYDAAVINLDSGLDPDAYPVSPLLRTAAQLPSTLPQPLPVRVFRGGLGRKVGMIVGSLFTGGTPWRQWRDCWILTPGIAVQGDSGAAVVSTNGDLVGMLVGGARQGGAGYAFHYLQDYSSTAAAILNPAGVGLPR
jgi:hypothetical protein